MKKVLPFLPELFFLVIGLVALFTPPFHFNVLALAFVAVFVQQLISRNKAVGIIIGGLAILVSIYMLLALLSEFSEFKSFTSGAKQMLFVGLPLVLLSLAMAGWMFFKNIVATEQSRLANN